MGMETIFISIASYRDKLLANTINEAYSKAKYKDNLVFGVFEQNFENDSINLDDFEFKNQIKYSRVEPDPTKGVCWARTNVQKMFNDETYYFQIDAHMLFDENWDEFFIDNLKELKKYHNKPIITAYPLNFNCFTFEEKSYKQDTVSIVATDNDHGRDIKFKRLGYSPPWGNSYHPSQYKMVHGYHLGGCCIFSEGNFVRNIPYDDSIYFGGEEPMLTLRAWTHGYNIFHAGNIRVYHCWDKQYGGIVQRDLKYDSRESDSRDDRAKKYINSMIRGEIQGQFGIGRERTVEQYIEYSGLDFFNYIFNNKNEAIFSKPYFEQLDF